MAFAIISLPEGLAAAVVAALDDFGDMDSLKVKTGVRKRLFRSALSIYPSILPYRFSIQILLEISYFFEGGFEGRRRDGWV